MVPGVSDGAGESILTVMSATCSCLPKRRVLTVAEATGGSPEATEPPGAVLSVELAGRLLRAT